MRNGRISHWFEDLGVPEPRPVVPGYLSSDVAIVGAGYTGLWTAYYLKKQRPRLRVVLVEQRHAGYGASGRNGGWLTNSITGGRDRYVASHGRLPAENFQRLMNQSVDEVISVCRTEGIDADIQRGGELEVAYTEAQESRLRAQYESESRWPYTDIQLLQAPEATARINVAGTRAALWHPHAARIHPAKLVTGLAEAVERLGVEIYENTRVTEIRPHILETTHGTIAAEHIIRATEGFTASLSGLRRLWLPMNSSMIVTEPLGGEVWEELNWARGEVLGDYAHVYMYAQRTADDRIALGGRGVPYRFGSRTDHDGQTPLKTVHELTAVLHRLFPVTTGASIEHTWSGVLGVPRDWAATVGFERNTGIGWAGGYVGTGVTATNLAGRTLADLVLGQDSEIVRLPWVNRRARRWEPEPLRWIATTGLYAAYRAADRAESAGRSTTSPLARVADLLTGKS